MTDLSPQAQAVLDAAFPAYDDETVYIATGEQHAGKIAAAALRALTEYSEMFYDPDEYADAVRVDDILKIVKELENV